MAQHTTGPQHCQVLVVDYQERMMAAVRDAGHVLDRARRFLEGARILGVPVAISEQYPKGLGHTEPEILKSAGNTAHVFEKTAFGCLGDKAIRDHVRFGNRNTLVVCGVETHVCVAQTVEAALNEDYRVHLIVDAVTSRTKTDHKTALKRLIQAGAIPHTVESQLFEWMQTAEHPHFKAVQALIK